MADNVLIDPSLIVCQEELTGLKSRIRQAQQRYEGGFSFYIPESFRRYIYRTESQKEFEESALVKFFASGRSKSDLSDVEDFIETEVLESFGGENEQYEEPSSETRNAIEDELSYYQRYGDWEAFEEVVTDEYVFLTNMSIISAARDKIVDLIERIGLPVFRIGKRLAENAIRKRTNMDDDDPLERVDILRGIGKYVILGFSKVSGGFSGALLGAAIGLGPGSLAFKLVGGIIGYAAGDAFVTAIDPSPDTELSVNSPN